jgi:hypothetical protein
MWPVEVGVGRVCIIAGRAGAPRKFEIVAGVALVTCPGTAICITCTNILTLIQPVLIIPESNSIAAWARAPTYQSAAVEIDKADFFITVRVVQLPFCEV